MSSSLIGQELGQYEIRALLGKGGMSTVYLAYQRAMDRVVAVKVLPREFLHDESFLTRFRREVQTIARLEHLHILPVYDVGEAEGIPYFVMRYLAGGTLADLIADRLPDMRTVLRVAGQVAGALDYAHGRGIIHRDLKPSNILLDGSGNAYLADFGIARIQEAVSETTGSHVIGTPRYVAPEMVRQGEKITSAVDVYALGVIVYEMLAGEPPYAGDDPMKVLAAHVLEPIPAVRDFDPNLSPVVDVVLRRCLAKQPRDRYATADEFVEALGKASQAGFATLESLPPVGEPTPSPDGVDPAWVPHSAGPPTPATTPPPRKHPRRDTTDRPRFGGCLIGLGILLALIAGMGAAAFYLTDGAPLTLLAVLTPIATRPATPTVTPIPVTATPSSQGQTPSPSAPPILPMPASGARLAFASNRDGDYEIYLVDLDGEGLTQLTDNETYDFDPAWSPDGNQIVYASTVGGDAEIRVMDADGGGARALTENTARDADPAWSPDGSRIAFASDREGDFDIYVMDPDGGNVTRLTADEGVDELDPAWSPDGSQIAYYTRRDEDAETTELHVIPAAGGETRRLTENDTVDQWPDWSPNEGNLAYTSDEGLTRGRRAIFVLDLATLQTHRATDGTARDDDPAWSPGGDAIAFDSDRDGDGYFDLYVLDVGMRELRQVTTDQANDVAPAWQPLP